MCLSIPGKVIEINGDEAIVDYEFEKRTAKLFSDDFSVGDYVVVSNKVVVLKIPENQARSYLNLIKDVREDVIK